MERAACSRRLRLLAVVSVIVVVLGGTVAWAEDGKSGEGVSDAAARVPTLVAGQAAAPGEPCAAAGGGCFLAVDGSMRAEDPAYRALVRRGRPRYLQASIELALALGGGTAWYWIDRERQVADWDYESIDQRFNLDAWRFDNNPFGINFIWHPLSGTGWHAICRSNQLSVLAAAGFGLTTSLLWEYALEFREKISINDMMVTTGSGVAMGEFVHWLGVYVRSSPAQPSRRYCAARWVAGFPRALHEHFDCGDVGTTAAPDSLGFRSDIWHRFDFSYALAQTATTLVQGDSTVDGSPRLHQLKFDGKLVALPGYLRPGQLRRYFADANITRLRLDILAGGGGSGVDLLADALLLGQHRQDIPATGRGLGHAVTVATSLAYQYRRQELGDFRDRLGILHFPGLAIDADLLGESFTLHGGLRVHGDFAGINALPYERWLADHPDESVIDKAALRKQGYYFGWGYSARLTTELALPRAALGAELFYGRYHSQEGLDRAQEQVTHDLRSADTAIDFGAWMRVTPLANRLWFELRFDRQSRRAWLEGYRARENIDRYSLAVGARL